MDKIQKLTGEFSTSVGEVNSLKKAFQGLVAVQSKNTPSPEFRGALGERLASLMAIQSMSHHIESRQKHLFLGVFASFVCVAGFLYFISDTIFYNPVTQKDHTIQVPAIQETGSPQESTASETRQSSDTIDKPDDTPPEIESFLGEQDDDIVDVTIQSDLLIDNTDANKATEEAETDSSALLQKTSTPEPEDIQDSVLIEPERGDSIPSKSGATGSGKPELETSEQESSIVQDEATQEISEPSQNEESLDNNDSEGGEGAESISEGNPMQEEPTEGYFIEQPDTDYREDDDLPGNQKGQPDDIPGFQNYCLDHQGKYNKKTSDPTCTVGDKVCYGQDFLDNGTCRDFERSSGVEIKGNTNSSENANFRATENILLEDTSDTQKTQE